MRDVPEIQPVLAIVLWRLALVADDWVDVKGLAPKILPPRLLPYVHAAMVSEYDSEEWILVSYVLNPLFNFGLLAREKGPTWPVIVDDDRIRITPLFRRFLSFAPLGAKPQPSGPVGFAA
jgi:hypothetical protein